MANEQIIGAIIASISALIVVGFLFYIFWRKEKTIQQKIVTGEIELENYKDYDLIIISGKQLKEFKERILREGLESQRN